MEGFGKKKISNLLGAIEKSKTPSFDAFIYAVGIDGVGRVAAKDLSKRFKTPENLKNATEEELLSLENIGEVTAKNILGYFSDEENLKELDALAAAGVKPKEAEAAATGGPCFGESVVLTGTLSNYKRSEAQKLIESLGGTCQSAVTSKTTLVVAGADAGSKLEKAQKLGIRVIDEAEFASLLGKGEKS